LTLAPTQTVLRPEWGRCRDMYGWLWSRLPGNRWVKVIECLLLFALVVAILFAWVFPWASTHLPIDQVTV
jgi:hypothetical protein